MVITIVNCLVALPWAFWARTVKLKVPVTVGVPVIAPFEARLSPVGKAPADMLHVIGVAPVAAKV